MDHQLPLVTLCVPTRNRASLLRESLPTILAQDHEPLEILISDNCSTDDTEDVCRRSRVFDPRVSPQSSPRGGHRPPRQSQFLRLAR